MHPSYVEVACKDMQNSATDLRRQILDEYTEDKVCDIAVSCDGTWQRRGCASLNGKGLFYECLVKSCKSCEMWATRKGTREYEIFVKDHDCPINHEGSARAMDASGVVRIFQRSVEKLKFYYEYRRWGYSKAYLTVVKTEPYPNKQIVKGECVGDVQKGLVGGFANLKGFFIFFLFMHFCPGTITTHAESINSDLQRGLDRRLRHIQH